MTSIEYLFPEVGFLYGDHGNRDLIRAALPDAAHVDTPLDGVADRSSAETGPLFARGSVDLVVLGSMSENTQRAAIEALIPHLEELRAYVAEGGSLLATGNACDILGASLTVRHATGEWTTPGLAVFDFDAIVETRARSNGAFLGHCVAPLGSTGARTEDARAQALIGHKSQFHTRYENTSGIAGLATVEHGFGRGEDASLEGFVSGHAVATGLVGPFLVLNPHWAVGFLERAVGHPVALPYAEALEEAHADTKAAILRS